MYVDDFDTDSGIDTVDSHDQKNVSFWPRPFSMKNDIQFTPVTTLYIPKDWLEESCKKLTEISKMDDNWDSYGAEAPNQFAIEYAFEVLVILAIEDLKPSSIDASAEGGVCMSFQNDYRYSDIECFNTGEVFAVTSKNGIDTEVWEVHTPPDRMRPDINHIKSFLNI